MTKVVVAAAVVQRGQLTLVTRRPAGVHLEGQWEFPGGKLQPGESLSCCLRRELHEELNVDAVVGDEVLQTTYDYGDRTVELHFLRCQLQGDPNPQIGQDMRWASRDELRTMDFPPADVELIKTLTSRTASP